MVTITIAELRAWRRKSSTMRPVRRAPRIPSDARDRIALVTYPDWSKAKSTWMSSGMEARIRGSSFRTRSTTARVEASARFVTGM
jgi:hypothetical protein